MVGRFRFRTTSAVVCVWARPEIAFENAARSPSTDTQRSIRSVSGAMLHCHIAQLQQRNTETGAQPRAKSCGIAASSTNMGSRGWGRSMVCSSTRLGKTSLRLACCNPARSAGESTPAATEVGTTPAAPMTPRLLLARPRLPKAWIQWSRPLSWQARKGQRNLSLIRNLRLPKAWNQWGRRGRLQTTTASSRP